MKTTGGLLFGCWNRVWRQTLVAVAITNAWALTSSTVEAQGTPAPRQSHSRDRTRELIDDYSNFSDDNFDRSRHSDNNRRPANQGNVDPKVVHNVLQNLANSLTQLTYALNDQMAQVPGLRQVYTEALRLSGAAVSMHKRADKSGIDSAMLDDLQQLDADWRELAYRMENVRGLSADARNLIADINDQDQRIRKLVNISPQLDRRQLNLKAAGLVADLENLQEDITSEMGNNQDSQNYRRSISRLRQIVLNLVSVVRDDRADTGVIVEEYKQFEKQWAPLATKLRSEDDRYIERGLRRVAASSDEIHQLLLLPRQTDQSRFSYLAKSLKKDIDEFFERTPLILVMQLPNSKQALPAAEQFYGACTRFMETVDRSQDQGEITESFRRIEQAQRGFNDVFRDVDSDRAVAVLNRIGQSVNGLRAALQIQRDDFDNSAASDLAASIQNTTEQLEAATKRWLELDRQQFTQECLQDTADMTDRAARLHDDLLTGKPIGELRNEMTDLYENWRRVWNYLVKCQTEDRPTLSRLSSNLTPAMVELRTIIMQ